MCFIILLETHQYIGPASAAVFFCIPFPTIFAMPTNQQGIWFYTLREAPEEITFSVCF